MKPSKRGTKLRLYPTPKQAVRLAEVLELHRALYNSALTERRYAYSLDRALLSGKSGTRLTVRKGKKGRPKKSEAIAECLDYVRVDMAKQKRELKYLRAELPEYEALSSQALAATIDRVDQAYSKFYENLARWKQMRAEGKLEMRPSEPGYRKRFQHSGWEYALYNNGWKVNVGPKKTHRVHLIEVGWLRSRGQIPPGSTPKHLVISYDSAGAWYASVTVEKDSTRTAGTGEIAFDWGKQTGNFIAYHDERKNEQRPDFAATYDQKIRKARKTASRRFRRGQKPSRRYIKAKRQLALLFRKARDHRRNYLHAVSAKMVNAASRISTEQLNIPSMVSSAKTRRKAAVGSDTKTLSMPGLPNVKMTNKRQAKSNFNTLQSAPSMLLVLLRYKLKDAGSELVEIDTKKWMPSRTCPKCGRRKRKTLSERVHDCPCGCRMDRDKAAALVIYQVANEIQPTPWEDASTQ